MKRFEELEHTADVGIRAYGESLEELFANAAAGMFSLITDVASVRAVGEYEVRVEARDPKALLFDFLSELLFLHQTEKVLLSEFDVDVGPGSARARVRGERIDRSRHPLHKDVKAVTYHAMILDPGEGVAQVIFDI